jgi:DHA1 family tetracycline resistance protein-like MFS transporter
LVLPESLPPEKRAPFRWARANPLGSLKLLRSHRTLARLAFVNFFAQLAHVVLVSVSVLYAGYRYAWNEQQVGLMLAFVGLCAMVVQGGLTGPVVTWLGARNAMLAGLAFGVAAFAVFGYAPTGVWFLAAIVLVSLWGIAGPAMMGIMTHHVSASEQGQLQGANSSVQSIAQLVGPGLFTYTFAHFIGVDAPLTLPGAPFYLAAIFLAMALLLAWRALAQQGDEPQA